jgi:hypothetical protein
MSGWLRRASCLPRYNRGAVRQSSSCRKVTPPECFGAPIVELRACPLISDRHSCSATQPQPRRCHPGSTAGALILRDNWRKVLRRLHSPDATPPQQERQPRQARRPDEAPLASRPASQRGRISVRSRRPMWRQPRRSRRSSLIWTNSSATGSWCRSWAELASDDPQVSSRRSRLRHRQGPA